MFASHCVVRMEFIEDLKGMVYIGSKVTHKGTHNLILVESYIACFWWDNNILKQLLVYQGCLLYGSCEADTEEL